MATWLYRLGLGAHRHRRLVLAAWLAVLAGAVCALVVLGGKLDNEFTIPGSESQQAQDTMAEDFPAAAGTSAQIVFTAPEGAKLTDPQATQGIRRTLAAAQDAPQVAAVIPPDKAGTVTPDGRTALAQVNYDVSRSDLDDGTLDSLEKTTKAAEEAGLEVSVGGQAYGNGVLTPSVLELLGVVVALAVLALTFGSLLAAGMPLLTAFVGVGTGLAGLLAVSSGVTVSSTALSLALMLGLAVGIDYALFVLSRHRAQLAQGMDPRESAGHAVGTAGSAVVFAGTTVVIALVGLVVVRIPFLTVMGLSAAATVLIAVLVAVTLLPALFGLAGTRLAPRPGSRAARRAAAAAGTVPTGNTAAGTVPLEKAAARAVPSGNTAAETVPPGNTAAATDPAGNGAAGSVPRGNGSAAVPPEPPAGTAGSTTETASLMGRRWARLVTRRPLLVVIGTVAALVTLALPAADLRLALPDNGTAAHGTSQRETYDTVAEAFGPGFNGPLLVLAEADTQGEAGQRQVAAVAGRLNELPGVVKIGQPQYAPGSGRAVIQVVPEGGPQDESTQDLVDVIRDDASTLKGETGAAVSVTGTTAIGIDVSDRLSASLLPFAAVVVGLCLILLLLVFRSLVVPVKATIGFLLSVGASFGAVVAVFQWGWLADALDVARTGPVVSFLPIVLMAVLFGLAMDYEVFLVSSMREEWVRTGRAEDAVVDGAGHASRVVTAAALIMFVVFASFVTTEDAIVKPIAFSLAFGVLVDAFVVRMTLVPAVLAMVGRGAWWLPRGLDRALPDLDIEGARLHEPARKEPTRPLTEINAGSG
ncbi:MMPL family transporter [Streptomyces lincolnensis]|uniref:MMPL family transporter n=1 Tax=Streptomyces lincolnensis TaxID=1915 RepID=UPI001E2FDF15|nr:MMPL family transporter [Streptomyces lincolnensis]MCD7438703.1 MMPL family transporter [Streptomyces lincolnensis]